MPLWAEVFLWTLACTVTLLVLFLAVKKVTKCPEDFPENGYTKYPEPLRRKSGLRKVGKHPALAAPYGKPSRLVLTPRDLSRINSVRRTQGLQPFNERGFRSAIAAAPITSTNSSDWFPYLIAYEIIITNHSGLTPLDHIVIAPEAPFNGQGGQYGGAGASGDWNDPMGPRGLEGPAPSPAAPQRAGNPSFYFPSDPPPALNPTPIWAPDPVNPCTAGLSAASAVSDSSSSNSSPADSGGSCGGGDAS